MLLQGTVDWLAAQDLRVENSLLWSPMLLTVDCLNISINLAKSVSHTSQANVDNPSLQLSSQENQVWISLRTLTIVAKNACKKRNRKEDTRNQTSKWKVEK